jgi:hypothetical protein
MGQPNTQWPPNPFKVTAKPTAAGAPIVPGMPAGMPPASAGQNLYAIDPPATAISDQTAAQMKTKASDQILQASSDYRRQLADQFAMMGMGRSGAFAGSLAKLFNGTGRDIAAATSNIDIEQAKTNADFGLNRARLGVEMRGQDQNFALGNRQIDTTMRGQDNDFTLGNRQIDTTNRGQTLDWLLGNRGQDIQVRGQDIQVDQFGKQMDQQDRQFDKTYSLQERKFGDESAQWRSMCRSSSSTRTCRSK